jgi:hypothetical protein
MVNPNTAEVLTLSIGEQERILKDMERKRRIERLKQVREQQKQLAYHRCLKYKEKLEGEWGGVGGKLKVCVVRFHNAMITLR